MRPEQIKNEIDGLELSEKLLLVEDIWDSIAAGSADIPMPEWQKTELDKRYKDFKAGELGLHDWDAVHRAIREKYQ